MYQVVVNRETLQNHLHYDWWKYVVGVIVTAMLWSLVTTMTRPQTPPEKKVDIFLVGDYALEDRTQAISQRINEDFPELLEVNFMNIPLGINAELEVVGRQKLMVMVGSQTGDIFVFNREEYEAFAKQGAFIPLDEFIDDQIQKYIPTEELEKYKVGVEVEYVEDAQPRIYGIPLKGVSLFKDAGYDTEDKVISVMVYSKNKEKAIEVMRWIVTKGR